jgi:hypothetical protein
MAFKFIIPPSLIGTGDDNISYSDFLWKILLLLRKIQIKKEGNLFIFFYFFLIFKELNEIFFKF